MTPLPIPWIIEKARRRIITEKILPCGTLTNSTEKQLVDVNLLLVISFLVYSALIVGVGLYSARMRKATTDDFVLANRELGPWASSLSASASSESGWVMLGLVGEAFAFGVSAFWIVPGIAAGYIFNWFFVAERLRKHSLDSGSVTLTQFMLSRFGESKALRWISVLIIVAAMLGYVAAQMNAAGKAFDAVFHLEYWLGVLAGAAIILAYTITGGFRAICWTDIVQAGFMFFALIGMPIVLFSHESGLAGIFSTLEGQAPFLLTWGSDNAGFAAFGFVIGLLGIGLGYPGQPHVLSRFMAARDTSTVNKARVIALVWMVTVYIGAILFGLFARAHYGTLDDPEQALPLAVSEFLHPIIGGFVIAAIVSAICSTADSQLITMSSSISRDVIHPGAVGPESAGRLLRIDRLVLVVLAMISVFFALTENRVIFEFVLYAWAVLGAAFGPIVILGLLWRRATRAGALAGMITGIVVTVLWRNIPVLKGAVYELVPAFVLAMAAIVIVSLLTHEGREESA